MDDSYKLPSGEIHRNTDFIDLSIFSLDSGDTTSHPPTHHPTGGAAVRLEPSEDSPEKWPMAHHPPNPLNVPSRAVITLYSSRPVNPLPTDLWRELDAGQEIPFANVFDSWFHRESAQRLGWQIRKRVHIPPNDLSDIDGIVLEVELDAIVVVTTGRLTDSLKGWMSLVADRKAVNFIRDQERRIRVVSLRPEGFPDPPDPTRLRTDLIDTIKHALTQLDPRIREIIELYWLDGLTISQIAAKLGMREGTVKSRMHYSNALEELFAILARPYLKDLPPKLSEVMARSLGGESTQEIADNLNLSQDEVAARIKLGRRELAHLIGLS